MLCVLEQCIAIRPLSDLGHTKFVLYGGKNYK